MLQPVNLRRSESLPSASEPLPPRTPRSEHSDLANWNDELKSVRNHDGLVTNIGSLTEASYEESPGCSSASDTGDGVHEMESQDGEAVENAQERKAEKSQTLSHSHLHTTGTSDRQAGLSTRMQTPRSTDIKDEDGDISASDLEDTPELAGLPKTTLEKRAQLRKMNRFR